MSQVPDQIPVLAMSVKLAFLYVLITAASKQEKPQGNTVLECPARAVGTQMHEARDRIHSPVS